MNFGGRPTTDPKGESVRVRINKNIRKKLDEISSQTGDSISEIIRKALNAYIDQF